MSDRIGCQVEDEQHMRLLADLVIDAYYNMLRDYSSLECVYSRLFERELADLGIQEDFRPVKAAANYSLLYLLASLIRETRPKRILELGCGQSTILISRLCDKFEIETFVSVDADPDWASRIAMLAPNADIRALPLTQRRFLGRSFMGFDPTPLKGSKFDFMLVDGPVGQRALSRFTAVEIAAAHLDEEFIVVFDDAERFGERRTIRKFEAMLRARDRKVWRGTTRAHKWQVVLASNANSGSVFV
jgi:predicted O-methyltransferase YrrM